MTDQWPFPGLPANNPQECPWEVFMRNDDGEWESVASFPTRKEAAKYADELVRDGDLMFGDVKVENVAKPGESNEH